MIIVHTTPTAITGDLTITTSDGTELHDVTDLGLAWKWAEHEVNAAADLPAWDVVPYGEQCGHVAAALTELRTAYGHATDPYDLEGK